MSVFTVSMGDILHFQKLEIFLVHFLVNWIHSDKGLTLETSALESLYGGHFTISYELC